MHLVLLPLRACAEVRLTCLCFSPTGASFNPAGQKPLVYIFLYRQSYPSQFQLKYYEFPDFLLPFQGKAILVRFNKDDNEDFVHFSQTLKVTGMSTRLNSAFGHMSWDLSMHLNCVTKELCQKGKLAQKNKKKKVRQDPKRWRCNIQYDCRDVLEVWFNVHWIQKVVTLTRNDVQNGVQPLFLSLVSSLPPSLPYPSRHHFLVFLPVCPPPSSTFISLLIGRGKWWQRASSFLEGSQLPNVLFPRFLSHS